MVTMSQPTPARSASAPSTSASVSPRPTISDDLVVRPAAFARASTERLRAYEAEGRTVRWRRATVSRLWFSTSGRASNTTPSESGSPLQSGMSTSTAVPGLAARMAWTVAANPAAPPSDRSSRATAVTTACDSPISTTASATLAGSPGSVASGRRVSTRQNPQARVHRSPLTMNVAVPSFQHSKMLGHPASSHTVTRDFPRIRPFRRRYSGPVSSLTFIHSGLRSTGGGSPGPSPLVKAARSTL